MMLSMEKLVCFSGTSEQQVQGKTGEKKIPCVSQEILERKEGETYKNNCLFNSGQQSTRKPKATALIV